MLCRSDVTLKLYRMSKTLEVLLQSARGRGLAYFVEGVRAGTASLVGNTVFAFSNATTKMSGAVRKGLLTIGLDQPATAPGGAPASADSAASSLICPMRQP